MLIMISEEHWENGKILFQMSEGIGSLQIKEYEKCFCDFCSMGIHACLLQCLKKILN